MEKSLLPIGGYVYNRNEYNLDEAWKIVMESHKTGVSIVCRVMDQCENKSLQVEFHGVKGRIEKGYITQNRFCHNEDLIGKTTRINIIRLNKNARTFVGTRIKVEEQAKEQLSVLQPGDEIDGVVKAFINEESCAFIDIKEGICAFLSVRNVTRLPSRCSRISDYINVGQKIKGRINFIEPKGNPRHSTFCAISLLACGRSWEEEVSHLDVGSVISGYPRKDFLYANKYFIEYSRQLCITIDTEIELDEESMVKAEIISVNAVNKKIYAKPIIELDSRYVNNEVHAMKLPSEPKVDEESEVKKDSGESIYAGSEQDEHNLFVNDENKSESRLNGSLFAKEIKAEISPFRLRVNEHKSFKSIPNAYVSMRNIENKIKNGQINDVHFKILHVINRLIYCTSKQIRAYLYLYHPMIKITQDQLKRKVDIMANNALIDCIKFESDEGVDIYQVYFLNKNGDILLQSLLDIKKTSYFSGQLVRPVWKIKRQLATNQILLAYQEKLGIIQDFYVHRTLFGEKGYPVRPSAILVCPNSTILLEATRRYEGWKKKLHDKMIRYQMLFQKYSVQKDSETPRDLEFLNMPLYLIVICEDFEHVCEIREILFGLEIYPRLLFTYDLLIFRKKVSTSVFRFGGDIGNIVYYDIAKMFKYNIVCAVEGKENGKNVADITDEFYRIFLRNYDLGLNYLQENDCQELCELVRTKLSLLYAKGEDGYYQSVFPEEVQYYIYLLFLIDNKLLINETSSFYEESSVSAENIKETGDEEIINPITVQEHSSRPEDLEWAVERVLYEIESWMTTKFDSASLEIIRHPSKQTSGTQYGYDVGMDFKYRSEEYHLGFECKNYQTLQAKSKYGNVAPLTISRYAYNLLEFFMSCRNEKNVHNHWILICPFGDLQNDFYQNLFRKWNREISFLQIDVFSQKQTAITCEELLALDTDAYEKMYGIAPPDQSEAEKNILKERFFFSVIGNDLKKTSLQKELSQYPFMADYDVRQRLMTVKTIEGENAIEQIFRKLNNHTHGGVFVVGEYGSGKTYLTYLLIKTILENPDQYAFYPLWLKLIDREIDLKCGNIEAEAEKFVNIGLKDYSNLPDDLSFGGRKRLLIILDGFDEIISGLGESEKKVRFLQKVCESFLKKYSYCNIRFLVTTREMDYTACKKSKDFPEYLQRFGKVILGECNEDDVRKGILDIKQPFYDEDYLNKLKKITQNECLVGIARKPLYFGFLRDLIISSDYSEYKDELEILDAIIRESVHRYTDSDQKIDAIQNMLYITAMDISKQLARGGSDSIEIIKSFVPQNMEKNVLQSKPVNSDHYQVRFYHNAIREYLVAKRLFQEVLSCFMNENELASDNLFNWMEELDMTPETMNFFCAFVKKETDAHPGFKIRVVSVLSKMLKYACEPSKEKLGTHVLSLLLRLQPELSDCDFERLHAGNMYLWNCSFADINLKNARLTNCTLFNMRLDSIDFRGADLSGLIMNSEDKILDVCHYVKNNELTVTVLYSTGQIIDYYFYDKNNLEQYTIKNRTTVPEKEYKKFISLDENVLIYSEKKIYSVREGQVVYKMKPENQLLYLDRQYAVVNIDGALHIVLHNRKYYQRHISGILQTEINTICVIDWNLYLTVRNQRLVLHDNDEIIPIMDLNASYECFAAYKKLEKDILYIYVKYNDIIQIISYDFKLGKMESSPLGLEKQFSCKKMISVSEGILYGISDDIVYIFNPLVKEEGVTELQTKVMCKNLILENEDGSQRIKGEKEYMILKEACDMAMYHADY